MKKTYLNPQTEMMPMLGANLMQAASPGIQFTGDIISGGGTQEDPNSGL